MTALLHMNQPSHTKIKKQGSVTGGGKSHCLINKPSFSEEHSYIQRQLKSSLWKKR